MFLFSFYRVHLYRGLSQRSVHICRGQGWRSTYLSFNITARTGKLYFHTGVTSWKIEHFIQMARAEEGGVTIFAGHSWGGLTVYPEEEEEEEHVLAFLEKAAQTVRGQVRCAFHYICVGNIF